MSRSIFITATGTGAGKTWVTKHLLQQVLGEGVAAQALKPIASGIESSGLNEDVQSLLGAQQRNTVQDINFHTYQTPVAPALAGQLEHQHINAQDMLNWIAQQESKKEVTFIEGVGGLMAPIIASPTEKWLVSDWLEAMPKAEVMLVVPLKLGCMSQVLLHCQYLSSIQRAPSWVILNDLNKLGSAKETKQLIEEYLPSICEIVPRIVCVQHAGDLPAIV